MQNVYFASLGCSKNLVDSQVMLGLLNKKGLQVEVVPDKADVIVVNTCSFIGAAKQESLDVITDLARYKKKRCKAFIVSGCLAQRYNKILEKEFPEIDLIIGTGEYHRIAQLLKAYDEGRLKVKSHVEIPRFIHTEFDPRINTSPFYSSWLKVSEGCNRNCTFCIIPTLRGKLRSRSVDSLLAEAKNLVHAGVREINIISQDLSSYGSDLNDNHLLKLLQELDRLQGLDWIRLFYFYPDELSDEIIHFIKNSSRICHYLDSPVQHFSDPILKKMNRNITGKEIIRRMKKLRKKIPKIALRSSVIVGFPGETEDDFQLLMEGIQDVRFNYLGIFRYSDEEGTPAFRLKNKVPDEIIDKRFDKLYSVQKNIAFHLNSQFVGKTLNTIIEGYHRETNRLIVGRHWGQAPDVDGQVIINDTSGQKTTIGDMVKVNITESLDFDLVGKIVPS